MTTKPITVTVNVPADVPVRTKDVEKKVQAIASLPYEHLCRLAELAGNEKALKGLKEHWVPLQGMFI